MSRVDNGVFGLFIYSNVLKKGKDVPVLKCHEDIGASGANIPQFVNSEI
jgi:hypothetical protein